MVPLPGLTRQAVEDQSVALAAAVDRAADRGAGDRDAQQAVAGVLRWLGATVVDPVLDHLGVPAGHPSPPRVWWSPVGALALLPVHAAAAGRVVSSYTPTLRALRRARARPAAPGPTLVVAMAETPGATPLPQAGREAAAVADLTGATVLREAGATAGAVRAALPRHPGVHFACHAVADPADPSAGRLLLHDHREQALTVREIADLDLDLARLAVLSACETSRTTAHLPDEALHLASSFQLAGYPEVVGTLWPVNDRIARAVAVDLYRGLQAGSGAAEALHAATERCRATYPDTPTLWAAYVHSGR
ncbi:CHAT domain-containing protein [Actinoplanes couchii]|uniref:CHAT domain-containing protein n=1 Tax=Actinoplanes couchii TaxID=403638 RepID=UPI00194457BC|nr:CHAT domain-containing protein [Actinoplanes couchii]MDR6319255.1 CHAT domain-containing protein [Actinoplanes couchii]